jgi:hypothetical protein
VDLLLLIHLAFLLLLFLSLLSCTYRHSSSRSLAPSSRTWSWATMTTSLCCTTAGRMSRSTCASRT